MNTADFHVIREGCLKIFKKKKKINKNFAPPNHKLIKGSDSFLVVSIGF